jgi:hypothetical protein
MNEYLYVLSNPSFPGRLKIGWTIDVATRIGQLFTTGVPTPFQIEFVAAVRDGREAERIAHSVLHRHRVSGNREFFALPVAEAVMQIITTIGDHKVVTDRQAAVKQAQDELTKKRVAEVHTKIAQLTKRAAELEQQIDDVNRLEREASQRCRSLADSLTDFEHRLKQLGPRPLKASPTWSELLSGKARQYELVYADHIRRWDDAEANVARARAALAKCETDLSHLRSTSPRATLRSERDAMFKEVDELKAMLRLLQTSRE